jgi:CheY-like chemotaxis protein
MQILVVEDEKKIAESLRKGLQEERHAVAVATTGEEAFFLMSTEHFDLLLLDIMLPGRDGLEILRTFRQKNVTVPYEVVATIPTAPQARNSLFVPQLKRFFVGVPGIGEQKAEVLVFQVEP